MKLYIETNHGHVTLVDAEVKREPRTWGDRTGTYCVAVGTVESSSETSRLFHATSTREVYQKGTRVEYPIYREPYCMDQEADSWRVSTVTCG
jgi:hypothetical protein